MKNNKFKLNPTIEQYLKENKDQCFFLLVWSIAWRAALLFYATIFIIFFLIGFFGG